MEVVDGPQHILAETLRVREPGIFLEDTALNAAAEVLGEIAVELGIDGPDHALGVYFDPGFFG